MERAFHVIVVFMNLCFFNDDVFNFIFKSFVFCKLYESSGIKNFNSDIKLLVVSVSWLIWNIEYLVKLKKKDKTIVKSYGQDGVDYYDAKFELAKGMIGSDVR